jgi:hypothetical protein
MSSASGLSDINCALNLVPKRAEARQAEQLRDTFVDSGVAVALEAVDHQVVYGRRGTGKTHAFRYLQTVVQERGDISFYGVSRHRCGQGESAIVVLSRIFVPGTGFASRARVDRASERMS